MYFIFGTHIILLTNNKILAEEKEFDIELVIVILTFEFVVED